MEDQWETHFEAGKEGYDFFQNKCSIYQDILDYHFQRHRGRSPILDTGAGTGNLTIKLAEAGMNVTAIDNSDKAIEILKKKCGEYDNITVKKMDVQDLDFGDESYAGVSSMLVIPFVKDNQKYLRQVYRVLRNGGLFTITAWAPATADVDRVNKLWESALKKEGVLPKYGAEWKKTLEENKDKDFAETVRERGLAQNQLKGQLTTAGFKDIEFQRDNPHEELWYSCVCRR